MVIGGILPKRITFFGLEIGAVEAQTLFALLGIVILYETVAFLAYWWSDHAVESFTAVIATVGLDDIKNVKRSNVRFVVRQRLAPCAIDAQNFSVRPDLLNQVVAVIDEIRKLVIGFDHFKSPNSTLTFRRSPNSTLRGCAKFGAR